MAEYAILMYARHPNPRRVEPEAYDRHAEDLKRAGALVAASRCRPPRRQS